MALNKILKLSLIVIVIAAIGAVIALLPRYKSYKTQLEQEQKISQIKELALSSLRSSGYPNEESAKENRKQICALTARNYQEREKAVQAIKEFLNDSSLKISYQCSDAFYDTTANKLVAAKSETYTAGLNTFIINPATDHIVQADIKDYKNSSTSYSQKEIETLGQEFIKNHAGILGSFDLSKLTYEIGKKGDGVQDTNYFLTYTGESKTIKLDPPAITCSRDIKNDTPGIYYQNDGTPCIKNYKSSITPTLQIAINNKGQILNYSNSFEGEIGRAITVN